MIKQEDNGTWTASFHYKDSFGISKHKTKRGFKYKKEAEAFKNEFLANLATDCTMLFSTLAENYLTDREANVRPTTMENKYYLVKKVFIPKFGQYKVNDITANMIRTWQNEFQKSAPYSETYKRNVTNMLCEIFYFAVNNYDLKHNPYEKVKKMGKARNNRINFWTLKEFNIFITALNDKKANHALQIKRKVDDYPLTVAFNILFFSGIRRGELLALNKNDFNFTECTMSITKTLSKVNGKLTLIHLPEDDKSNRTISMPEKIIKMVEEYISKLEPIADNDRIFFMLNESNLRRALKSGARVAGLKEICIHDLRHSHASLLINQGYSIKVIADRLGHKDVQTTLNIYGHLYDEVDKELAKDLNKLIE